MVSAGAFHATAAVFRAPPKVPAAHDKPDLYAKFDAFFERVAYAGNDREVQSDALFAGQRFPAEFQQDAFVNRLRHFKSIPPKIRNGAFAFEPVL